MMFLATAFMAVFLLEVGSDRQVHPVQYLLVGLAMMFFYILLLSFAEQIGFLYAYLIAAAATGGLISAYVASVQASLSKGLVMAGCSSCSTACSISSCSLRIMRCWPAPSPASRCSPS